MSILKAELRDLLENLRSSEELSTNAFFDSNYGSNASVKNGEACDPPSTPVLSAFNLSELQDNLPLEDNELVTQSPEPTSPQPPSLASPSPSKFEAVPAASSVPLSSPPNLTSCSEDESINIVDEQLQEVKRLIGSSFGSLREKRKYLNMLQKIRPATQRCLRRNPRSLRPPPLQVDIKPMGPGKMAYFGIQYILNKAPEDLFKSTNGEVRLTVNIDGVPVFKSNKFNLWPILACIEEKPVFIIGVYAGKRKPACSNTFLKPFVEECIQLRMNGVKV